MDLRELTEVILADENQEESMGLIQSGCNGKKGPKRKTAKQQKERAQTSARRTKTDDGRKEVVERPLFKNDGPKNVVVVVGDTDVPSRVSSSCASPTSRRHSLFPLSVRLKPQSSPDLPSTSPSMAAATFMTSWRQNSVKNGSSDVEEHQTADQSRSSGEGSWTNGQGAPRAQSLSELSHEVLAQIIRFFPFSPSQPPTTTSLDRPKLCRTLSQPLNFGASAAPVSLSQPTNSQEGQAICGQHCEERGCDDLSPPSPSSSPIQQRLQNWQSKASNSIGRMRRAASNLSGPKRERPKNLPLFGEAAAKPSKNGALNRLCRVSIDTMAITALPLDCWLKERLKNWVQLSGHKGTIVPASNHSLWKKQPQGNPNEAKAYAEIMRDPALHGITPKFFREIQHRNEAFIEIQDLLAEFPSTSCRAVMDIKIGTRTFLEEEVANRNKRADLYRKMMELSPEEPTEEEHREGAITKLRYMQFRERRSSSGTLGFRIEAAQLPGGCLKKEDFKKLNTRHQVLLTLMEFFGERRDTIRAQILERLKQIRKGVERSHFFGTHEVVGSSILLIHDERRAGAWLIDFAKCTRVEGNRQVSHRAEWQLGNHEDGYLTGLDNLIGILDGGGEGEGAKLASNIEVPP